MFMFMGPHRFYGAASVNFSQRRNILPTHRRADEQLLKQSQLPTVCASGPHKRKAGTLIRVGRKVPLRPSDPMND